MVSEIVKKHEEWRSKCLNLIASENVMSPAARSLLSSDLTHRYTAPDGLYRGTKFTDEVINEAEKLAKKLFKCKFADVRPISGHVADLSLLMAFRGKKMACIGPENGGYPGLAKENAPSRLNIEVHYLPFDKESMTVNLEAAVELVRRVKPDLVVLGASLILFPYPVRELSEEVHDTGGIVAYDASHVLGLIAGGEFQDPLAEGSDIMLGSTHKTLSGSQGGMILGNGEVFGKVREELRFVTVDNAHYARIAALALTLKEMEAFGGSYARQVVRNARKLAESLDSEGIPVMYAEKGYTRSHQILIDTEVLSERYGLKWEDAALRLEESNIIVDLAGRIGVSEVTRLGMKEEEMESAASLIASTIKGSPPSQVKHAVEELRLSFQEVRYCFEGS